MRAGSSLRACIASLCSRGCRPSFAQPRRLTDRRSLDHATGQVTRSARTTAPASRLADDLHDRARRGAQGRPCGGDRPRRRAARSGRGARQPRDPERHVPLPGDQARRQGSRQPRLRRPIPASPAASRPSTSCSGWPSSAARSAMSASSFPTMRSARSSSARWCSAMRRRALQYGQDRDPRRRRLCRADRPRPLAADHAQAPFRIPARRDGAGPLHRSALMKKLLLLAAAAMTVTTPAAAAAACRTRSAPTCRS